MSSEDLATALAAAATSGGLTLDALAAAGLDPSFMEASGMGVSPAAMMLLEEAYQASPQEPLRKKETKERLLAETGLSAQQLQVRTHYDHGGVLQDATTLQFVSICCKTARVSVGMPFRPLACQLGLPKYQHDDPLIMRHHRAGLVLPTTADGPESHRRRP